jgi:hypothetical protein
MTCKHKHLRRDKTCKDCGVVVDIRPKRSKYGAKRVDGFDSLKEARRYQELLLMQKAGEISDLQRQAKFALRVNGIHVCNYFADFTFTESIMGQKALVVEDVKSSATRTPVFILKKKLMWACLAIDVRET